jgi:hypothetical protein
VAELYSNPDAKTIELELFNALCKDGLVSKENAVDPKKVIILYMDSDVADIMDARMSN